MSTTEPPKPEIQTIEVSLPLLPVPQSWSLSEGETNGEKAVFLTITQPFNVAVAMFTKDAALNLCEAIREKFSDITVARPDALRVIRDADAKAARRP